MWLWLLMLAMLVIALIAIVVVVVFVAGRVGRIWCCNSFIVTIVCWIFALYHFHCGGCCLATAIGCCIQIGLFVGLKVGCCCWRCCCCCITATTIVTVDIVVDVVVIIIIVLSISPLCLIPNQNIQKHENFTTIYSGRHLVEFVT